MSGLSVCPDTRSEVDPRGRQDAGTERSAGGCGQQVAKATQSSLSAHQIDVSRVFGVGFAALLSSVLRHMLLDQPKTISLQHFNISTRYLNTTLLH